MVNPDQPKPKDSSPEGAADDVSVDRVAPVAGNVTGRVKFDDRGNAVWEWAVSTGSFGAEASKKRLRKLENASRRFPMTADHRATPHEPPRPAHIVPQRHRRHPLPPRSRRIAKA